MARDINELTDERPPDSGSLGEEFHDEFLTELLEIEWPPALDETAKDVAAGDEADVSAEHFAPELGPYYRRGLERAAGPFADLPAIVERRAGDSDLGHLAVLFNEFVADVARPATEVDDVQGAVEGVVETLLTSELGLDPAPVRSGEARATADLVARLLGSDDLAAHAGSIADAFERNDDAKLLSLLDEPRLCTSLWGHQLDALVAWYENGCRGYADLASGTGKTVLGLAALAFRYGELLPTDPDLADGAARRESDGRDDVLVLAPDEAALERWRRGFERHLNVPRERTSGADVTFSWARVRFRTPQSLAADPDAHDLVVLDDAHRYATGSEWSRIVETFGGDVLATSSVVDDPEGESVRDRLAADVGPEVKRYAFPEAVADGVVPSFDWERRYAPFDADSDDLERVTERCENTYGSVRNRLHRDELEVDADRRMRTYRDLRAFANTAEGVELSRTDAEFRELATRLFARRTERRNLTPSIDAVADLVADHATSKKVVVLADGDAHAEALASRFADELAAPESVYSVSRTQDRTERRETVAAFDEPGGPAVLVGADALVGDEVVVENAAVAVDAGTGETTAESLRRVGRVLQAPHAAERPEFHDVVGVPRSRDATVPREDGMQLVEEAATLCALGSRFGTLPKFSAAAALDVDLLGHLLHEGAVFVEDLDADGAYEWPVAADEREHLRALQDAALAERNDTDATLASWNAHVETRGDERWESVERVDGELQLASVERAERPTTYAEDPGESDGDLPAGYDGDGSEEDGLEAVAETVDSLEPTADSAETSPEPVDADPSGVEVATADDELDRPGGTTPDGDSDPDDSAEAATGSADADGADGAGSGADANDADGEGPERETVDQVFFWDRDANPLPEDEDGESATASRDTSDSSTVDDPLDRKIDEWKSKCLDLTRRNKLVDFTSTKTRSLPLDGQHPPSVAASLVDEERLYILKRPEDVEDGDQPTPTGNEVLSTRDPDQTAESLYRIGLYHKQHLRERGVDTLYLAVGMLRWHGVDGNEVAMRSPLFLAPVELEERTLKDADRHNYVVTPKAEGLRFNPALRKKLATEYGLSLPADEALSLDAIDAAFETVYDRIQGFENWTVQDDVILGVFDFVKFSLYTDLEENREAIKSNPIIRALNDDPEALQAAEGETPSPTAEALDDDVDPVDTYQVLDADSSQQEAIEAAKRGKSFVLQGPPGTGKSQTIANIIAEKLAAGEKVLFVSEKQAALDVVKDRLDDVGVGRFCLEAHGRKASNTNILSSIEDELNAPRIESTGDREAALTKLRSRRETINEYGDQLFYSPPEWTLTSYQAFGIVADTDGAPRVDVGIDEPLDIPERTVDAAIDELETLARFEEEIESYDSHRWRNATLRSWAVDTSESMRRSLAGQRELVDELRSFARSVRNELGVDVDSLSDFETVVDVLAQLADRPDVSWRPALFDESFVESGSRLEELAAFEQRRAELIEDLRANYERSFLSADGAGLTDELAQFGTFKALKPSYRSLRSRILNHAQDGYDPGYGQLLEDTRKLSELQRLENRRDEFRNTIDRLGDLYRADNTDWEMLVTARDWTAAFADHDDRITDPIEEALVSGELPAVESLHRRASELQSEYDAAASFFRESMAIEEMTVDGQPYREAPLEAVADRLDELHAHVPDLQRWVQFSAQLDRVDETICSAYVDRFLSEGYPAEELVPAFKNRFYTTWLNAVYDRTALGSFNADEMERYLEEFRRLDVEQMELANVEIQREVTSRRPSLNLEYASGTEQVIVRREIEKQRRHKPIRDLFDEASSFITRLTPCFMMSPLSVAQYVKTDAVDFDTVIFDEASQIMPEDAVSSLIRADQAIIAGDTKQLPPTSFFEFDTGAPEAVREDLDSILEEAASVLPEKHLRWHYRSRTKELIEFSNHQYYNGDLRTFPENDPDVESGVEFEYVPDGVYDRGGTRRNEVEASRVLDLVEDHVENHADKSLGVVAFSSAQEQAIRDELEERREENATLDAFVGQDDVLDEFFIKNLEMVQGDERDRVIFSVGYGPDENGDVSMNFGPLNADGGERRLNVAVTRAKEQVVLVSSLQPGDIDVGATESTGVKHFRAYLEYTKRGGTTFVADDANGDLASFDSRFEEAVHDELEARGYDVVSFGNESSYSLDMAVEHPDREDEFVLGIECDGAAYRFSKTARDRDRLRQSVLEGLGWTIHRIWSPDWVSNRERELGIIEDEIDRLAAEDANDAGSTDDSGRSATDEPAEDRAASGSDGETDAADDGDEPGDESAGSDEDSRTDHEAVTTYHGPSLSTRGDRSLDDVDDAVIRRNILELVDEYGPVRTEDTLRRIVKQWQISRLGKSIRRTLDDHVERLEDDGELATHDGFLWPPHDELEFGIRINDGEDARKIDEIPLEEIARGASIVLSQDGPMPRDDLSLETAKLVGYHRRGQRIKQRIAEALDLLADCGAAEEDEDGDVRLDDDADVDVALLQRVYS